MRGSIKIGRDEAIASDRSPLYRFSLPSKPS